MMGSAQQIDGKYDVLALEEQGEGLSRYRVFAAGRLEPLTLDWFEISSSAQRSAFHLYRGALRALAPAGLVDVVARPGAYYALWQPLDGQPLAEFLALPVRDEAAVRGLHDLSAQLAEQGFALGDAEVIFGPGGLPQLAHLSPAAHSPAEAQALNAEALAPLKQGRVRRQRAVLSPLAVLPGALFLLAASYLGAQAARIYLNPPVRKVQNVTGQAAGPAASALADRGFRVIYADGEKPGEPTGSVIAQDPPPGSDLSVGRQVTLTVNNPPPLTVPKLDELSLDQVDALLAENRLSRGEVLTVDGAFTGTPKGRVIAQLPAAGTSTQRGEKVTLLVSGGVGSRLTWLPPLSGLSFEDARDLIRRAGLVVATVVRQPSDARENTIISQKPAAYVKVEVGSPVDLKVATARYSGPSQSALPLPAAEAPPAPAAATPSPPAPAAATPSPAAPATAAPAPVTPPPTTPAPSTSGPATPAPATPAPATPAPATPAATDAGSGDARTVSGVPREPAAPTPARSAPPTQTPATQTPATQTPATQTPATQTPSAPTPAARTPATQTPAPPSPVTRTPAIPSPATPSPSARTPAPRVPATRAPAAQTPAAQAPAAQSPTTPTPSSPDRPTPAAPSPSRQTPEVPAAATPPEPAGSSAPAGRTVELNYTFPATLPDGTLDILVRDQDGERTVLAGTPSSTVAGATAQQDGISVRGEAVFVVRVNGQEYTRFPAR